MNARQLLTGLGWSAAGTALNAIAQLAFLSVLARLLEPGAFGLMAMAAVALRFASYFAQLGLAQALIQKPELRPVDTSAALLMALGLGLALYVVVVLAAPLPVAYFQAPELTPVLAGFGWSLVAGSLAALPLALLRRHGRFKAAAAVDTVGYLLGFGAVGIGAAAAGWGVWSLVAATLTQQFVVFALGFAVARPRLGWPVPADAFGHHWRFGARYSLVGFLEFIWANLETLAIGRLFGKDGLGVFNRAVALSNLPIEQAVNAVSRVMFPAFSSLAQDRRRLADAFCMLFLAVGVVGAAIACGIAAAADDVVQLLLGPRWAAAAPLVAVVAVSVPPLFMYVVCGLTLDSVAALGAKLRLQAFLLILKAGVLLTAASHGLVAIAWAVVFAEVVRLSLGLRLVVRELAILPADWRSPLLASVAVGAMVFMAVSFGSMVARAQDWTLTLRLVAEIAAGALALAGSLLIVIRSVAHYPPLLRVEVLRRGHARLLVGLRLGPLRP